MGNYHFGCGHSATPVVYMKPVSDASDEKSSEVYRSPYCPDGRLVDSMGDGIRNCHDLFLHGLEVAKDSPCLGTLKDGKYAWRTYGEVYQVALEVGSGLLNMDAVPMREFPEEVYQQQFRFLGLYSKNREEWAIAEQACNAFSFTIVPLYDTLGPETVQYVCDQTRLRTVITQVENVPSLIKAAPNCPELKIIVAMDEPTDEMKADAQKAGVTLTTWQELIRVGKGQLQPTNPPKADSVNTICYTSGTTGLPKGVIVTHRQFVSTSAAALLQLETVGGVTFGPEDVYLSYLPFAHIFERIMFNALLFCGGQLGFYRGDTHKLMEDVQLLKPTLFASVPRLYSRIFDKIQAKISSSGAVGKVLFSTAMNAKLANLRNNGVVKHAMWDSIIFNKINRLLGGRVRVMVTGSAPISPQVHEFLKCAFSAPICEGYGMTETCAASTLSHPGDTTVGHIGGCFPCIEAKLVSQPEMDYTINDKLPDGTKCPRGELCLRGPSVFPGYFRQPDKTSETIDGEGWLHTGDIAQILPNGAIRIVDRKKNIFKLAQGEYVSPEKVENVYSQCGLIAQSFVHGSSTQTYCVGIIHPDHDEAKKWAKANNKPEALSSLCSDAEFIKAVEEQMAEVAKKNGLSGIEKVKKFRLSPEAFTVDNDLVTPTYKLKRHQAHKHFKAQIDEMYGEK
ncbi:unnamed protein product [Vitrella brassicaformis CCMP3155]|uniref:Long-chain-fatty-acid--CoA ligase n=2 Tax=Vitrella brassicaformis TaxID=1169539 RepID=A0A0G4FY22_VITBC|nr:Long-chain acyl-CoA synthetase [Vitrella brassicaformis]CEM19886.1 unnamed protein product [Vitrella brassicaformis CCMP3155]|mmetsp:Transcript_25753/g.63867  ORF Transcript_25753/g.63867 Transcript_25753/m.63867 type:complete len:677 (+) Transcript_25753:96-2126(+)|eukprot:CEM19886.1 unnamed protein product [Vitrella brassicaformis CCMP3155]